jgi:hypothetical protein
MAGFLAALLVLAEGCERLFEALGGLVAAGARGGRWRSYPRSPRR